VGSEADYVPGGSACFVFIRHALERSAVRETWQVSENESTHLDGRDVMYRSKTDLCITKKKWRDKPRSTEVPQMSAENVCDDIKVMTSKRVSRKRQVGEQSAVQQRS